jgi:hypothetical protein
MINSDDQENKHVTRNHQNDEPAGDQIWKSHLGQRKYHDRSGHQQLVGNGIQNGADSMFFDQIGGQ